MSHTQNTLNLEMLRTTWEEALLDNEVTAMVAVENELKEGGYTREAIKLANHRTFYER